MTGVSLASVLRLLAKLWAVCLLLQIIWIDGGTEGAISHHSGACLVRGRLFSPGKTFIRDCEKCYCHNSGFLCLSAKKPTSWPKKCQRVQTKCGYRVVYRENPEQECRAYSWIG